MSSHANPTALLILMMVAPLDERGRRESESEHLELVAQVLAQARSEGATEAEAVVVASHGLKVGVRLAEVETVENTRDRGLSVTVYHGKRKGKASTSDLSSAAIRATVGSACSIARHTGEDPCHGLAPATMMAIDPPDLDLYHPWDLDADAAAHLALQCEEAARDHDPRISNSEGASVTRRTSVRAYGNSHGFLGAWSSTRHSLGCAVIAGEAANMQRDFWYTTARDAESLDSPEAVGSRAASRAISRLGGASLSTRETPVLFSPEVATGLVGHFVSAIRGSSLYRKASFLLDGLGHQVFPEDVQIIEEPHLPMGLGSAPFDNDGVATRARTLVEDGVLQAYVLNAYSACRLGLESTGNAGGVHNLTLVGQGSDLEGLIPQMGRGLLVTELMGMGVNTVTGGYSRGAAGFWIEAGAIAHPVQEVTIAGDLREMYRSIVAVGSDLDARGSIRAGSVLVEKMTVAGG